jgi:hypothetical protein
MRGNLVHTFKHQCTRFPEEPYLRPARSKTTAPLTDLAANGHKETKKRKEKESKKKRGRRSFSSTIFFLFFLE